MEDVLYQQSQGVNLNKKLQLRIFTLFFVKDYQNFLFDAAKKPYIIGYHRCQYMDRFNEDIMQLKQGMVQENGSAYEPHASLVTEINKKAIFIFSKRIKQ